MQEPQATGASDGELVVVLDVGGALEQRERHAGGKGSGKPARRMHVSVSPPHARPRTLRRAMEASISISFASPEGKKLRPSAGEAERNWSHGAFPEHVASSRLPASSLLPMVGGARGHERSVAYGCAMTRSYARAAGRAGLQRSWAWPCSRGNFAGRHSSLLVFASGHHPILSLLVDIVQLCLFAARHQIYILKY
jgi:hypothetical protein